MNPDWQDFLARHGATIETGIVQRFGDASAELRATAHATVLCDLGQFGTLRVSGEDAQSFLQNLLSNDIREVSPARAQLSSLNSPKGRVLATMMIWRDGDDYLLQLPQALCELLRKKLSMYVLRAKVKIADASADTVCLGLSGSNAVTLLKDNVLSQLPKEPYGVEHAVHQSGVGPQPHFTIIRLGDNHFQVSTAPQYAPALWKQLTAGATEVGSPCWDWLSIRSGIPVILPRTQEQFVAQMVNFELLGGVSFKKGCYPGQEIVARMQYLGKPKRRMYLAHLDGTTVPQAGDELFSADMEGQASGMLVNAAPAPDGGYDVLAVVQIASREAQPVHHLSLQGTVLQFLPLPYPLTQS